MKKYLMLGLLTALVLVIGASGSKVYGQSSNMQGVWVLDSVQEKKGDQGNYHTLALNQQIPSRPNKVEFSTDNNVKFYFDELERTIQDNVNAGSGVFEVIIRMGDAYVYNWSITPSGKLCLSYKYYLVEGGELVEVEQLYFYKRLD